MNHNNSFISNSETIDFAKLAKRLALFSVPFLLAAAFIFAVDPFNFFGVSPIIPNDIKFEVARQFDPCFWKLNQFDKNPTENVLLGDSRMAPIEVETIQEVSGKDFTNLGYGGGTVRETIETFWLISKKIKLNEVYIGVNLEKYNDYELTNRVEFYKNVKENPALYFVNKGVWESAAYCVYDYSTGAKFTVGVPDMTPEEFWNEEIKIMRKYYDKYAEPKKYRKELKGIADYCKQNNIELKFIVFPTSVDAQNVIKEANFTAQNIAMRRDLQELGKVYDFDWENNLTRDRNNFIDPVHITKDARTIIIKEIWGANHLKFGKLIARN